MLRGVLSAHRSMLEGALQTNRDLDIDRAFHVHAGLSKILAHWDDYNATEQRRIISTVEYLVNPEDDDVNDLTSPDGFADDLAALRRLQDFLGYV